MHASPDRPQASRLLPQCVHRTGEQPGTELVPPCPGPAPPARPAPREDAHLLPQPPAGARPAPPARPPRPTAATVVVVPFQTCRRRLQAPPIPSVPATEAGEAQSIPPLGGAAARAPGCGRNSSSRPGTSSRNRAHGRKRERHGLGRGIERGPPAWASGGDGTGKVFRGPECEGRDKGALGVNSGNRGVI